MQNKRRNKIWNETKANAAIAEEVYLKELSETILDMPHIDKEIIDFLAEKQRFTKHPNLGLAYYHLCSSHPDAFVFNDETLNGDDGKAVCERLMKAIGPAIGKEEALRCQQSSLQHDASSSRIAACASCNEILFACDNNIVETKFHMLHEAFLVSNGERLDKMMAMDDDILRDFVSVVCHDNKLYHLNPDLIPDMEEIILCSICAKNPLDHPYSIASGHDYGRRLHFPDVNGTTLSAVCPVRNYNIDVLLKANHATGHSICFPSNGPTESSKELPCVDPDRIPHVTFLGPKDKWRKQKGKWKHLYQLDCDKAYEALRIWVGLRNPAFDGIKIEDTKEKRANLLDKVSNLVQYTMVITEDPAVAGISCFVDEQDSEETGENKSDTSGIRVEDDRVDGTEGQLVHSAVLPQQSLATTGKNSGI